MRFLHVFDTAGTAALLGKHYKELGHEFKILQLRQLDPFGFGDFYGNTDFFTNESQLINHAVMIQKDFDEVIVHDYAQHLHRFKHPSIFYHGSMLKHMFATTDIDKDAKNVFLMMPHMVKYRPNGIPFDILIDRDHFKPQGKGVGKLCITNQRNRELTVKELPPDVDIRIREGNIIAYKDVPKFLATYAEYWEARYDYAHPPQPIPDPSGTALQCMSMGLKVVSWNKEYTEFPEKCDSRYFAKKFLGCYQNS